MQSVGFIKTNVCLCLYYSIYSMHGFDYTNAKHLAVKNKAACSLLHRGLLKQGAESLIHWINYKIISVK